MYMPNSMNHLITFDSEIISKKKEHFLKLKKNQIHIMDALMNDGSIKKYQGKKKQYHYSEHAGLLDFQDNGLERITISGRTNRQDHDDTEILFPHIDWAEAIDYEYMFHTHPPSPYPGSRIKDGILYEFPSPNDFLHFIDYYNRGMTQGSMVVVPEGLYVIFATKSKISINEKKFYKQVEEQIFDINELAIKKYKGKMTRNKFYQQVSPDRTYVKMFNKFLKPYDMILGYQHREKIGKNWVINDIYLPVMVRN